MTRTLLHRTLFASVVLGGVLATAVACFPLPFPPAPDAAESETPSSAAEASAPQTEASAGSLADTFRERDEFMKAQKLPLDGSPLVAVTPAQKQFIDKQRQYVESKGGSWDSRDESQALALVADGCETAILNGHRVDESIFRTHFETEPLVSKLIPADATTQARRNGMASIASVTVYGMTFLCPEDGQKWLPVYKQVYGG